MLASMNSDSDSEGDFIDSDVDDDNDLRDISSTALGFTELKDYINKI